jgi:hypothetical protein
VWLEGLGKLKKFTSSGLEPVTFQLAAYFYGRVGHGNMCNIHCTLCCRERANKRKLQETVREFSLMCRGLIGTDYTAHSSPFF